MTRIMILEDNKDSLNAITKMIEKVSKDMTTVSISSLEEARKVLQEAKEPFHAFLLILT